MRTSWEVENNEGYAAYIKVVKGVRVGHFFSVIEANRAVLCVNACAGIDSEDLKSMGSLEKVIHKAFKSVLKLDVLKSNLDEALKYIKQYQKLERGLGVPSHETEDYHILTEFLSRMELSHGK